MQTIAALLAKQVEQDFFAAGYERGRLTREIGEEFPRMLGVVRQSDDGLARGRCSSFPTAFGARCAYTIDGGAIGGLQAESFTAVEVKLVVEGVAVHPGYATGKLVSAVRLAAQVVAELPSDRLTPDTTSGREGFIHVVSFTGTPDRAELRVIVRDFEEDLLDAHVALLRETAERVVGAAPRASLQFELTRQYHNMRDYLASDPDVLEAVLEAVKAEGIEPLVAPIRGGTDGSRLSEMGLPTPNVFDGGYEYHSVREWASVQEMAAAAAVIVRLAEVWSRR